MRKLLLPIAALSMLAGCVTSQEGGVMQAETRKGGFAGLSTLASVEASRPAAFAGKTDVVVGGFKLGFNESKRVSNKAGGGLLGSGFGGKATGLVKLEGVPASVQQSITDQAYKDFVAALKANGYNVLPRSQFAGSEYYDGTKEYAFPYTNDTSGFLSSYGASTYYSPSAIGSKQPIFMGEIDGVTGGIGFSNPGNAAAEYSKETGVAVLNVAYFVDFAGSDGHGSYWSNSASVKVGQLLSVDQGHLGIVSGHAGTFSDKVGSLSIGQPIASDKEFATIADSTSGAERGAEIAGNVLSSVLGGGTNVTKKYTYNANSTKYKAASLDVLSKANAAFVGEMVAKR